MYELSCCTPGTLDSTYRYSSAHYVGVQAHLFLKHQHRKHDKPDAPLMRSGGSCCCERARSQEATPRPQAPARRPSL